MTMIVDDSSRYSKYSALIRTNCMQSIGDRRMTLQRRMAEIVRVKLATGVRAVWEPPVMGTGGAANLW